MKRSSFVPLVVVVVACSNGGVVIVRLVRRFTNIFVDVFDLIEASTSTRPTKTIAALSHSPMA
jgi:hypothetical protein